MFYFVLVAPPHHCTSLQNLKVDPTYSVRARVSEKYRENQFKLNPQAFKIP